MIGQLDIVNGICAMLKDLGIETLNTRQLNAIVQASTDIALELAQPHVPARSASGVAEWLASDDTGISSRYMLSVLAAMAGLKVFGKPHCTGGYSYPRDPSDFGRCVRLLDAVPELREHLHRMADAQHGPAWAGYVSQWDALERLYREELPSGRAPQLYDRMQSIQRNAEVEVKS